MRIEFIESSLGVRLPESYREFVTRYGAVWTPELIECTLAQKAAYSSVQDFLKPTQILSETRNWRKLCLPADYVAFATDCTGSLFAFRQLPARDQRPEDAAIWFFDHEEGTTEPDAASFDDWISRSCRFENPTRSLRWT